MCTIETIIDRRKKIREHRTSKCRTRLDKTTGSSTSFERCPLMRSLRAIEAKYFSKTPRSIRTSLRTIHEGETLSFDFYPSISSRNEEGEDLVHHSSHYLMCTPEIEREMIKR
jgi:hypothetical protein